ncbi:hypothetical protein D9M68_798930 [compost metagenome]
MRARLKLKHLSQQRQRNDDRGRFKVNADAAVLHEGRRKGLRDQGRGHAVEVGGCRPKPNERPHVGTAVTDRGDPTNEEGPAGPQGHRRRQHELHPVLGSAMEQLHLVRRHGQQRHNDRQWQGPPEPPGEILELRIFFLVQLRDYRLQGHSADRTATGARLANLRVHWTGVFGSSCTG